jgi:AsmA family protein
MFTSAPNAPPARPPSRRRARIALAVAGVLVAVPLVALALLLGADWNKARPWLDARAGQALGRPFHIAGPLTLTWETPAALMPGRERSWRDFVPWPHLVARDVHIGNPPQMAGAGDMAGASELSFSLNPLALLERRIVIPVLRFDAPSVRLERRADGSNNWTFTQQNKASPWQLELDRVIFSKGVLQFSDAVKRTDLVAEVDTLNADPTYGVAWSAHGSFNGSPASGTGKAGAVLSLQHQSTPYPIMAELHLGANHVVATGTLTKPTDLAALDMQLEASGPSMARLYALTGVLLPETPRFSTRGHLNGTLGAASSHWVYDRFTGKIGSSDIEGTLDYRSGAPRGMLKGDVLSHLLQFRDLGPLIGADSNASKAARGVAPVQPPGKVLPVEAFRTERWKSVDADVKFTADRVVREKQLPINRLSTHLRLQDGVITLLPLRFDMAGGALEGDIRLDGAAAGLIKATAKVGARHIKIKQLFPGLAALQATVGEINGDAQLSATGNSVASLLAHSNGELKTLIDHGTVSKLLLEEMGLNIGNVIIARMFGDRQVELNCMATDFVVTSGVMQARSFIIDTDAALIAVSGDVNLATERLDLTIRPDAKGVRVLSLRAPLYLRGPFANPDVSVDKRVLAMRAGGALALAAVAPLAALLPLVNAGPGHDSSCASLIADARTKPLAPPPGKPNTR